MTEKIINCYELDIKQDIPAEMEIIRTSNENLKNSNRNFRLILLSVGFVIVFIAVYQNSKMRQKKEHKF